MLDRVRMLPLVACLVALTSSAAASHFRFAHVTWRARPDIGPTAVQFAVDAAWRRDSLVGSAPDGYPQVGDVILIDQLEIKLDFGDGSPPAVYDFQVTALDVAANWVSGPAVGDLVHVYPATGSYVAAIDAASRISQCDGMDAHVNSPEGDYRIETAVEVGATASPVSSLPPIVSCPQEALCRFAVPALWDGGPVTTFRLSTTAESGVSQPGPPFCPAAATIDAATGMYEWDTRGCQLAVDVCGNAELRTLYSSQVVIGNPTNHSAIDFLIRLVPAGSGDAPAFASPPSPCGATLALAPGARLDFGIEAADGEGPVCVNAAGLPVGPVVVPPAPVCGNPAALRVSWTPTTDAVGEYLFTFTAVDAQQRQASCTVSVGIRPKVCTPGDAGCESCGDCTDNDGNFLVDMADPVCGAVPLDVQRVVGRRKRATGVGRLRAQAVLEGLVADLGSGIHVQATNGPSGALVCETIPAGDFKTSANGRRFRLRRPRGSTSLTSLVLAASPRKGVTRVRARFDGVALPEEPGSIGLGLQIGDGPGRRGIVDLRRAGRRYVFP